jgi:hypothetical protein
MQVQSYHTTIEVTADPMTVFNRVNADFNGLHRDLTPGYLF